MLLETEPMLKIGRVIALIILCALWGRGVVAQTEQLKFRHLDISNGLSHHEIATIFKDSRGFIWIGTAFFGLNRFDGNTVKSFLYDARDTTSLINNSINQVFETPDAQIGVLTPAGVTLFNPESERFERNLDWFYEKYGTSKHLKNIVRDRDGTFWFIESHRVMKYIPSDGKSIVFKNIVGDTTSIVQDSVSDFSIDQNGNHWIVHSNGIAEKIDEESGRGRVIQRVYQIYDLNKGHQTNYYLLADRDGDLWFCAPGLYQGVFYYELNNEKLHHLNTNSPHLRLNTNAVSGFVEGDNGAIWIGTDHGGINIVDKKQLSVRYIYHRPDDGMSIAENSIICFYKDDQGTVWVGTYKRGVSYYHKNIYRFDVYKRHSLDANSLPFEDINRFAEDENGNIWIGTNGGGLLYFDRQTGKFKQYLNEPKNENSLSGNVIVSLCIDAEENLWIGTYNEGLSKFDGKKFTRYKHVPGDTSSLPSKNIWEVFEDSRGGLWIGTLNDGVALLDRRTDKFQRIKTWGPNAMQSMTIDAIMEDRHGNIWFGTANGIDVLSPDAKNFTHFEASSNPHSLSNNGVLDIREDSKGRIWVATMDGLNLFDSVKGFRVYKENLPHKAVLTIQEDNLGRIWIGTLNGLCEMTLLNDDPTDVSFKRYIESDGLQGLQFNLNASLKTRGGELVFGGPTGFNIFRAEKTGEDLPVPRVIFSDLRLHQKSVGIGEKIDGIVVLNKSVSEATEIVLPPNKNSFSIKFSALEYFNPEKNQYLFMLEDLNSEWLPVESKNHEIVFNSLNPGQYKLRVKAANIDGVWGDNEAVLSITVKPPFWKTNIAFMLYAFLLMCILFIARRLIQQREKLKFALVQERREIQRVHELDMMKVKFFTNVSHEFRTPLTLILTPIERLIKRAADPDQIVQFRLIHRNGKRLMSLVNQLLDFKKLEVQAIKFNPSEGDIVSFVKETVLSFSDLTEKKNIKLEFHTSIERMEMFFDQDKLEKILFNLLSNAFKFTLENGTVSVNLTRLDDGNESLIQIEVRDTGIGIAEDKLDKIFEPFFQNDLPKSMVNQGSGIGLAITKEFVKIHGGRINIKSEVGKGSTFIVLLPLKQIAQPAVDALVENNPPISEEVEHAVMSESSNPVNELIGGQEVRVRKKSLLLVEDNDDFRFYLKDNLRFSYTIIEARNGAEGWAQVLAVEPDLIVSDIMMPEMNGIDLCAKIKSDARVSHIPVILLTARSSEEQKLEGFQTGADDYVTKPFSFEILEARINNLLRQREKSQKTFRKTLDIKASELQITPLDVKFVENAVKIVEKNVSSPDFSVEDLGMELGISRAYIYKKILALTGKSPLEFIRTIRLQHAAQLLEKSQLSVREVAYKVGFNNPKYFTKYFKEQFHVLPSNYAASRQKDEKSIT